MLKQYLIPQGCKYEGPDEAPGFDKDMGNYWVYPTNYPERQYQFNIIEKALYENVMVSLPTGLGKTFIAAVVMYNYYRWFPSAKIIFLAPTRPLVRQQIDACYNIVGIPKDVTAEMTGTKQQNSRADIWNAKRVFFATPQVLDADLDTVDGLAASIRCIVFDEAHKARGNYSYCEVVKKMYRKNRCFRVLALSATPGNSWNDITDVVRNLLISHIEMRTEESEDVTPYVNSRTLETIVVPLNEQLQKAKDDYIQVLEVYTRMLIVNKVISGNSASLTKGRIFLIMKDFQNKNKAHPKYSEIMRNLNICVTLYHAYDVLVRHGLRGFLSFCDEHASKPLLRGNEKLHKIMEDVRQILGPPLSLEILPDGNIPPVPDGVRFGHPKFYKLQEILLEYFNGKENADSRVIVFFEYKDSVNEAFALLSRHRPLIEAKLFLGQSSMSQRQQIAVMNSFRAGKCNTLLSTCIGEEGLDIGEVNLIICFDISSKSPIRMVQRMGRTGRKNSGKVVILVTEGREQQTLNECLHHKNYISKLPIGEVNKHIYIQSPRMVPKDVNPTCTKMLLKITKTETNTKKKSTNNNNLKQMFENLSNFNSQDSTTREFGDNRIKPAKFLWKRNDSCDNFESRNAKVLRLDKMGVVKSSIDSRMLKELYVFADLKRYNLPTTQTSSKTKQGDIRTLFFGSKSATNAPKITEKSLLGFDEQITTELFNEVDTFNTINCFESLNCKICDELFKCADFKCREKGIFFNRSDFYDSKMYEELSETDFDAYLSSEKSKVFVQKFNGSAHNCRIEPDGCLNQEKLLQVLKNYSIEEKREKEILDFFKLDSVFDLVDSKNLFGAYKLEKSHNSDSKIEKSNCSLYKIQASPSNIEKSHYNFSKLEKSHTSLSKINKLENSQTNTSNMEISPPTIEETTTSASKTEETVKNTSKKQITSFYDINFDDPIADFDWKSQKSFEKSKNDSTSQKSNENLSLLNEDLGDFCDLSFFLSQNDKKTTIYKSEIDRKNSLSENSSHSINKHNSVGSSDSIKDISSNYIDMNNSVIFNDNNNSPILNKSIRNERKRPRSNSNSNKNNSNKKPKNSNDSFYTRLTNSAKYNSDENDDVFNSLTQILPETHKKNKTERIESSHFDSIHQDFDCPTQKLSNFVHEQRITKKQKIDFSNSHILSKEKCKNTEKNSKNDRENDSFGSLTQKLGDFFDISMFSQEKNGGNLKKDSLNSTLISSDNLIYEEKLDSVDKIIQKTFNTDNLDICNDDDFLTLPTQKINFTAKSAKKISKSTEKLEEHTCSTKKAGRAIEKFTTNTNNLNKYDDDEFLSFPTQKINFNTNTTARKMSTTAKLSKNDKNSLRDIIDEDFLNPATQKVNNATINKNMGSTNKNIQEIDKDDDFFDSLTQKLGDVFDTSMFSQETKSSSSKTVKTPSKKAVLSTKKSCGSKEQCNTPIKRKNNEENDKNNSPKLNNSSELNFESLSQKVSDFFDMSFLQNKEQTVAKKTTANFDSSTFDFDALTQKIPPKTNSVEKYDECFDMPTQKFQNTREKKRNSNDTNITVDKTTKGTQNAFEKLLQSSKTNRKTTVTTAGQKSKSLSLKRQQVTTKKEPKINKRTEAVNLGSIDSFCDISFFGLKSPVNNSPKLGEKEVTVTQAIDLINNSPFKKPPVPIPSNNKNSRKPKVTVNIDKSFDDENSFESATTSIAAIRKQRNEKIEERASKEKIQRRKFQKNDFLDVEAEISDDDNSEDEVVSSNDEYEASFVNDESVLNSTHTQAMYMKSTRDNHGNNRFKLAQLPRKIDANIFSQAVENNDESYVNDSFCVDSDEETVVEMSTLDVIEMQLEEERKNRRKARNVKDAASNVKKRRRILVVSSDSE